MHLHVYNTTDSAAPTTIDALAPISSTRGYLWGKGKEDATAVIAIPTLGAIGYGFITYLSFLLLFDII